MSNILKNIVIDAEATIGNKLLLLEVKPYYAYKDGIKQNNQEGLSFKCLSESLGYEKIDIKVAGITNPPFEFTGTPIPIEVIGADIRLYQDWGNKGLVKAAIKAKEIRPVATSQKLKVNISDK